ncbi:MAG: aldo/keto reductase [Candidatus Hydrogenedentes bacterium]|nr:aldo/keto reductase [Candidatus Hydrogenedentota bacterium]
MNRREFMKRTAGAVAATMAIPSLGTAQSAKLTATTVRTLGNTGLSCSLLGMGTGTNGWGGSSNQTRKGRTTFVSLLEHGHAQGLTYIDMADMYGSHDYVKAALKNTIQRDKVMLLTKTVARDPKVMRADLERFRKELDTDYLDIVLLHCQTDRGWPEKMRPCMDVLEEAKGKGQLKAHGVSCHDLGALKRVPETPWADVVLARINPFGLHMDGSVDEIVSVLRQIHDTGQGVLGMKIVGNGDLRDRIVPSLQFVLGLDCVDAFTIGFESTEELDGAMGHVAALYPA